MPPIHHRTGCQRQGTRRFSSDTADHPWHIGLPDGWKDMVAVPIGFEVQHDEGAAAARAIGYDEEERPCYCRYTFTLNALCYDDGDDLCDEPAYSEELSAWRLRDGRWLIRRVIVTRDDCNDARAFYCFSESMPR